MDTPTQQLENTVALVTETLRAASARCTGHSDRTLVPAEACTLSAIIRTLDDTELERLLADVARGRAELERVLAAAAGEVAKRSERGLGHSGLAQRKGHRGATEFVRSVTGVGRGEAARQIKLGEFLGEAEATGVATAEQKTGNDVGDDHSDDTGYNVAPRDDDHARPDNHEGPAAAALPWEQELAVATSAGLVAPAHALIVMRTIGELSEHCTGDSKLVATRELIGLAQGLAEDEFARAARVVRDRIDPAGVEERFRTRYENRGLRTWRGRDDGAVKFAGTCDDTSGVFLTQLLDLALSPRRQGPRFVSDTDRAWAQRLVEDARSNEQLAFDTLVDVLRAGAACDASTVFRAERPGVRVLTTVGPPTLAGDHPDRDGTIGERHDSTARRDTGAFGNVHASGAVNGTGHLEGSDNAVPAAVVEAARCDCGVVPIALDGTGRPLDLGRSQRTFSSAQRVVLRARDGGCLWPGCDRPAWLTEAHHINPWKLGGRTDVADGVLLCRFHHLTLHNNHWQITRHGERYELIPPAGNDLERRPIPLTSKSAAWQTAVSGRSKATTPPGVLAWDPPRSAIADSTALGTVTPMSTAAPGTTVLGTATAASGTTTAASDTTGPGTTVEAETVVSLDTDAVAGSVTDPGPPRRHAPRHDVTTTARASMRPARHDPGRRTSCRTTASYVSARACENTLRAEAGPTQHGTVRLSPGRSGTVRSDPTLSRLAQHGPAPGQC